ncbi:MAG: hypothetical protein J6U61_01910, partial [Lachnospiraceae bacterium]|nr:hypothetical protein [Lachnospiraceae bacterium]
LDEPVSGLDPVAARDMYELTSKINKEQGIAIIMVSHDLDEAMRYSNHILHLSHKQLFFGKTRDYIAGEDGGVVNPIERYLKRDAANHAHRTEPAAPAPYDASAKINREES